VNNLNTGRRSLAASGDDNTSALAFGGLTTANQALTESWPGSNWTEASNLNSARQELAGAGASNTNALAFGGRVDPPQAAQVLTEQWDGASWVETSDLNTATKANFGSGTNTSAINIGGTQDPPILANTEEWSGSSNTTKTVSTD